MTKAVRVNPQARLLLKEAFERFEGTVTPSDKRSFKNSTLQDVWAATMDIQDQMAARRFSRDMRGLQAFLDGLQRYSAVVEVLCNGTPYLPWIWAPVKLTLEIVNGHISAFDTVIRAYNTIAIALPRFDNLENAFADNRDFQQVLAMVYADILEIHRRIYKFTHRKAWHLLFSGLWSRFDIRFKGLLDSLAKHSDLVDREANAIHIAEAKKWRDKCITDTEQQEQEQAQKHLLNVLAWLGAADAEQDNEFDRLNEACHRGTCSWIRQNDNISAWSMPGRSQPVLWMEGKPGSGKSVLVSKLVQSLFEDPQDTVLFYICSYRFSSQNHSVSILKRLCSQLLRKHIDLVPYVYDEYVMKGLSPSLVNLKNVINSLLQMVQQAKIIVDGLDELDEKEHASVLRILLSFVTVDGTNVKVMVASRDVKIISKMLRRYTTLRLNDERHVIETAIKSYVRYNLSDLRTRFSDTLEGVTIVCEVEDRLVNKSDGMFLYARLVLAALVDVYSLKELQDAMNTLPEGLDEAYGRCLQTIRLLTSRDQEKAIRILEWIAYGAVIAKRPVKKSEIQGGIALATNDSQPSELMLLSSDIFDLCKPLVIDGPGNSVVFVHFSVQEYLTHNTSGPFLDDITANYNIAVGCIRQLIHSMLLAEQSVTEHARMVSVGTGMHNLHLYADEHWCRHTMAFLNHDHEADQERRSRLLDMLTGLANSYSISSFPKEAGSVKLESQLGHLDSDSEVHQLIVMFVNNRKITSDTISKATKAPSLPSTIVSAPVVPWDLIRDQYNACVHHLLGLQSLAGLSEEQLHKFKIDHAPTAYTCRIRPCARATDGFPNSTDRDRHELLHTARLICDEPGCQYPGFPNAKALQLHKGSCHGESSTLKRKRELPISIRENKRLEVEKNSENQKAYHTIIRSSMEEDPGQGPSRPKKKNAPTRKGVSFMLLDEDFPSGEDTDAGQAIWLEPRPESPDPVFFSLPSPGSLLPRTGGDEGTTRSAPTSEMEENNVRQRLWRDIGGE